MTVGHSLRFNLLVPDTEDGLLVLALDVVPLEAVVVHVVQDGHAAGIKIGQHISSYIYGGCTYTGNRSQMSRTALYFRLRTLLTCIVQGSIFILEL